MQTQTCRNGVLGEIDMEEFYTWKVALLSTLNDFKTNTMILCYFNIHLLCSI